MKPQFVVSDFDGVVGNSLSTAINIISEIAGLFDNSETVGSFADFKRLFGKNAAIKGITPEQNETLKELYRILMLHRGDEIKLFSGVLRVYSELRCKPLILSSSYSGTIRKALGKYVDCFEAVYGYDSGKKENMMAHLNKEMDFIYITDSKIDIRRCCEVGVPVIAVAWGYDSVQALQNANRTFSQPIVKSLK